MGPVERLEHPDRPGSRHQTPGSVGSTFTQTTRKTPRTSSREVVAISEPRPLHGIDPSGEEPEAESSAQSVCPRSGPSRSLDSGDVDLLHRHHGLEGTLRLIATSRERIRERAWGDLP
jgi:hypothetical protein